MSRQQWILLCEVRKKAGQQADQVNDAAAILVLDMGCDRRQTPVERIPFCVDKLRVDSQIDSGAKCFGGQLGETACEIWLCKKCIQQLLDTIFLGSERY